VIGEDERILDVIHGSLAGQAPVDWLLTR